MTNKLEGIPADTGETTPAAGHNSGAASIAEIPAHVGGATGARLRSFIEQVERLEEEKKAIAEDIKEVFGEAKSDGFDVKIIRMILKRRKKAEADIAEEEALFETYMSAIGM